MATTGVGRIVLGLKQRRANPPSAARERLQDDDFDGCGKRLREVARLLAVDEDAYVAPDAVLLVDDAKADARVLLIEVGEQRRDMNRCGTSNDNAYIESFFHSTKSDIVHGLRFKQDE